MENLYIVRYEDGSEDRFYNTRKGIETLVTLCEGDTPAILAVEESSDRPAMTHCATCDMEFVPVTGVCPCCTASA